MQQPLRIAAAVISLAILSACASRPAQTTNTTSTTNAPVYSPHRGASSAAITYGTVRNIESIGNDQARGGGAVVGGIVGAVVGRQFADSNRGKNVGTVAGAVGGALIGNEIEKNSRREQQGVRVTIQLDHGGVRSYDYQSIGELRVGDRVRIDGNQVYRL
jgi:outer membrane lipoprotein SlyB